MTTTAPVTATTAEPAKQVPGIVISYGTATYTIGLIGVIVLGFMIVKYGPDFLKKSFVLMFKEMIVETIQSEGETIEIMIRAGVDAHGTIAQIKAQQEDHENTLSELKGSMAALLASIDLQTKQQEALLTETRENREELKENRKELTEIGKQVATILGRMNPHGSNP